MSIPRPHLLTNRFCRSGHGRKATAFLDAEHGLTRTKCVNCHASFAYLMARRPALPVFTEKHGEVRKSMEDWIAYLEGLQLDTTSDARRCAEAATGRRRVGAA